MPPTIVPGAASAAELKAHLAVPEGHGPWPGVVVLHEILGLTDDTRSHADRLARDGYLALAPDLFTAGGARRCLRATFAAMRSGRGDVFGDIEASRALLAGRDDCTGAVGVVGFCLGGGFALLAATRGFDASAPNYGPLPGDVEQALRGACPIVASYGRRDLPLRGAAAKLGRALERNGVPHDIKVYDGVGHSFMNRHGPAPVNALEKVVGYHYDDTAAEDAWARILHFFAIHLSGRSPASPQPRKRLDQVGQ